MKLTPLCLAAFLAVTASQSPQPKPTIAKRVAVCLEQRGKVNAYNRKVVALVQLAEDSLRVTSLCTKQAAVAETEQDATWLRNLAGDLVAVSAKFATAAEQVNSRLESLEKLYLACRDNAEDMRAYNAEVEIKKVASEDVEKLRPDYDEIRQRVEAAGHSIAPFPRRDGW